MQLNALFAAFFVLHLASFNVVSVRNSPESIKWFDTNTIVFSIARLCGQPNKQETNHWKLCNMFFVQKTGTTD